jgi:signal transduction histidine kinase
LDLLEQKLVFYQSVLVKNSKAEGTHHYSALLIWYKDVDIVLHWAESLPRRFYGDPTRIHQILANLLSNAVKFTEKGVITIHVDPFPHPPPPHFKFPETPGNGVHKMQPFGLQFTVKDTGHCL